MGVFDFLKRKPKQQQRSTVNNQITVRTVAQRINKYNPVTDPYESLKSSVVFRCIRILAGSVATTPISIYHKNKEGFFVEDEKHAIWKLLNYKPNKRQTSYEMLEGIVTQLVVYGNAYIHIRRNSDYDVEELTLLYPHSVTYDELNDTYTVSDMYNKISGTFKPDKIIHIRHASLSTFLGISTINCAAKTIGLAVATDAEALDTMKNGGKLKGIISSESSLTGFGSAIDSQVDTIRDNLEAEINSGKDILTLQSGCTFTPMSQSLRDLELIDLHQSTLSDLARYFGVSPAKLGILQGSNYIASLQDNLNFYTDTLNPLLKNIENSFTAALINTTNCRKYKIEFDRTSLVYFKELLTSYEKMQQLGIITVNDIRKKFNKNETEGGDGVFVTTNSQLLTRPKVDPLDESGTSEEEVKPQEQPTQEEPEINKSEKEDNKDNE